MPLCLSSKRGTVFVEPGLPVTLKRWPILIETPALIFNTNPGF
jgi:hypothetical protein